MKVELWSDVVCPWCYIGRTRFEKALARWEGRETVELVFRSFELDPEAPVGSERTLSQALAEKYGLSPAEVERSHERVTRIAAEEGLAFRLDLARPTNTLAVHRLLQLAGVRHIRPRAEDRFQRAYFTEGASFADPETLLRLATEAGLKEDDARRVLAGQAFTLQVRADEKEAAALGARGVPFFVFDRKEAVYGAQSTDAFVRILSSAASHGPN